MNYILTGRIFSESEWAEFLTLNGLKYDHTSYHRGYQTVKNNKALPYCGKFGRGYVVYKNNTKSSQYCFVDYYIERETEK